jgi:hypothetical protein
MIYETYKRRNRNGEPEIYTYDQAPEHMRNQICQALSEGIGLYAVGPLPGRKVPPLNANPTWEQIDRICRKELLSYPDDDVRQTDLSLRFRNYVLRVQDMDDFLSAIHIGCVVLLDNVGDHYDERESWRPTKRRC